MKKKTLLCLFAALLCLPAVSACDVQELGSLQDLSKPYVGVYSCETLEYGGESVKGEFEYFRLDLGYGGGFELSYRTKEGAEGKTGGTYRVDLEKEEIAFTAESGAKKVSRTFFCRHGSVVVELIVREKLLYAVFSM